LRRVQRFRAGTCFRQAVRVKPDTTYGKRDVQEQSALRAQPPAAPEPPRRWPCLRPARPPGKRQRPPARYLRTTDNPTRETAAQVQARAGAARRAPASTRRSSPPGRTPPPPPASAT